MKMILVIGYFVGLILMFSSALFIYGEEKVLQPSKRVFDDECDLLLAFVSSVAWPIVLVMFLFYGIFQLPIMLGKYYGKKEKKSQAIKEFKETINQK